MRIDLFSENRPGLPLATIDLDPVRVRGSRSVFGPSLHIGLQVIYESAKHIPVLFEGTMRWPGEHSGLQIPLQTVGGGTAEMIAPLSDHQIAAIEQKRAGNELVLELDLRAVGCPDETGRLGRYRHSAPLTLAVPRDRWKAALDGFGVGSIRIVELPSPPASSRKAWQRAFVQLDSAAHLLSEGRYGESTAAARAALERVAESVGQDSGCPRDGKAFGSYIDELSAYLKDRKNGADPLALVGALMKTAFGWTSHPVHQGFAVSQRDDAVFAVNLCIALYSYLVRAQPFAQDPSDRTPEGT